MAKMKSRWVCQECGFQASAFLGRCTECSAWGSLVEEVTSESSGKGSLRANSSTKTQEIPTSLNSIQIDEQSRISTNLSAVDEVLGGGLVPGSVVLLAGDPGIGKSTLLLQVSKNLAANCKVLYISAEESAQQVKLRAHRLGINNAEIFIASMQNIEEIEKVLDDTDARVVIIDSIQAVYHPEISSAPGSVSQVRESAAALVTLAKHKNIATILVGHVTKDGTIAGPRVLEHMVDVVLQFEGERLRQLRILRAVKNRFGSTSEIGIFTMAEEGLAQVDNPSAIFLGDRLNGQAGQRCPSGTAVIAGGEGTRALLLEVQALVGASPYPSPRRVANGWDLNRLLQILAVLEKKVGISLSRFDVYINMVGGFNFSDPAGDLGVAVAIATSSLDRSIDSNLILIGEIGLTGEVRPVASIERRLKEAAKMGFTSALVPKSNLSKKLAISGMEISGVESLAEALEKVMPGQIFSRDRKTYNNDNKQTYKPVAPTDALVGLDI